jgi:hypothetical protein
LLDLPSGSEEFVESACADPSRPGCGVERSHAKLDSTRAEMTAAISIRFIIADPSALSKIKVETEDGASLLHFQLLSFSGDL